MGSWAPVRTTAGPVLPEQLQACAPGAPEPQQGQPRPEPRAAPLAAPGDKPVQLEGPAQPETTETPFKQSVKVENSLVVWRLGLCCVSLRRAKVRSWSGTEIPLARGCDPRPVTRHQLQACTVCPRGTDPLGPTPVLVQAPSWAGGSSRPVPGCGDSGPRGCCGLEALEHPLPPSSATVVPGP